MTEAEFLDIVARDKAARAMLAALKAARVWAYDDDGPVWADSTIKKVDAAIAAAKAAGIKATEN